MTRIRTGRFAYPVRCLRGRRTKRFASRSLISNWASLIRTVSESGGEAAEILQRFAGGAIGTLLRNPGSMGSRPWLSMLSILCHLHGLLFARRCWMNGYAAQRKSPHPPRNAYREQLSVSALAILRQPRIPPISFASDGDPKLSLSPHIGSGGMERFGSSGHRPCKSTWIGRSQHGQRVEHHCFPLWAT